MKRAIFVDVADELVGVHGSAPGASRASEGRYVRFAWARFNSHVDLAAVWQIKWLDGLEHAVRNSGADPSGHGCFSPMVFVSSTRAV
jgi:hypothetical protein